MRLRMRSLKRSRQLISAVLPVHTIICYYFPRRTAGAEWWKGTEEQLTVTLVPRMSSRPIWQLKLDVCTLSVSNNSYKKAYSRASVIS